MGGPLRTPIAVRAGLPFVCKHRGDRYVWAARCVHSTGAEVGVEAAYATFTVLYLILNASFCFEHTQ